MDLNKDNKDIYTVDAESYSAYMHENWKKPTDFLSSFIKLLLVLLLLVVAYFFYYIVKADLSFTEVFNKKELLSTYKLFNNENKEIYVEKEDYVEVLAKNMPTDLEETKRTVVLAVSKKHDEPVVQKKEELEESVPKEVIVKDVNVIPPVQVTEELIVLIPKEVEENILESVVGKVKEPKVISDNDLLSAEYLDKIMIEMNSL